MTRTIVFALVVGALTASASAGELIEMRDGRLIEAERVEIQDEHVVLHLAADGEDGSKRVPLSAVDPKSATRAWAAQLPANDADGWTRLATFARKSGLFDIAEHGYGRAAATNEDAAKTLDAFRKARPREESKHHFETADAHFRAKRRDAASVAARAAVKADKRGTYAAMARELIDMLAAKPKPKTESPGARRSRRALERLEPSVNRGERRLRAADRSKGRERIAVLYSGTRILGEAAERLGPLTSDKDRSTRERASKLLERVQRRRVGGLLLLADLRLQSGATKSALTTVHEVLAIDPNEPLALDLRERLLADAELERQRERDLLYSGARRRYHAYPYPARDVVSGVGLSPTRDPVRGLGRLPYSRPAWQDDVDDGGVVVVRRRR